MIIRYYTDGGFKHRYGMKLMNSGLNLGQDHILIANVTSEMSLIYAKQKG